MPVRQLPRLTANVFPRGITFTLLVPSGNEVLSLLSPVRLLLMLRASRATRALTRSVLKEPRITRACSTSEFSRYMLRNIMVTIRRSSGASWACAYATSRLKLRWTLPFLISAFPTMRSLGCAALTALARSPWLVGVVPEVTASGVVILAFLLPLGYVRATCVPAELPVLLRGNWLG